MVLSIQEMTHRTKVNEENYSQIDINPDDVGTWRREVTSDLEALTKRIEELERQNFKQRQSVKLITSFAESKKDNCFGLITAAHLLRTSCAARLQCFTLLIVITIFSFCAISFFLDARSNENADWKPVKIDQVIEYGNTEIQYEMPYLYIAFKVSNTERLSDTVINETLSQIENLFMRSERCSIRYFSSQKRTSVGCEWFAAQYDGRPSSNFMFWGYFKLKLDNPTAGNGSFVYSVDMPVSELISRKNIDVSEFWVSITRDEQPADFSNFIYLDADEPLSNGTSLGYTVDYTESAVDNTYYFTNSIAWVSKLPSDGILRITGRPNLRVQYWTEYISFGYSDWIFGMGGLYSFFCVGFFFTAYRTALCCNDNWSMGILPRFSITHRNLEMIHWLKYKTLPQ